MINNNTKNFENKLFTEVIKNEKTCKSILKYLSSEEEENVLLLNKEIYNLMEKTNFIHYKYLTKKYEDGYLFNLMFQIEIKNLSKVKKIIKESDKLFSDAYNQSHLMIIIYYFSFLIIGISLFFFFLIIGNDKNNKRIKWYSQIPLIFIWCESLIIIIIYVIRMKNVVYLIINKIKKEIPNLNENEIKYFRNKIIYRINNLQPLAFWYISFYFLCFYFPVLIKVLFEKLKTSYEKAYISTAWIIFIFILLFDFGSLTYNIIKHRKIKIDYYRNIYLGKAFYLKKMEVIKKKENKCFCGEVVLTLLFFLIKCFSFAVILIYLKHLGRKFDNLNYKVKWNTLFIPIYIINGIIAFWGILYMYSIRTFNIQYKLVIFIIIILEICCSSFLGVSIPLYLDETWKVNLIYPSIAFSALTISIIIHYCILKKKNKDKGNNKRNIFININNEKEEIKNIVKLNNKEIDYS